MKPAKTHPVLVRQIRKHAKLKKWSMNRLADFAGISRGNLSQILGGTVNPTLNTLEAIAEALEVELADLLSSDLDHPRKHRS